MNFVLIHFLAKSCWTLLLVVVQIVWERTQRGQPHENKQQTFDFPLSVSKKAGIMSNIEEQQTASTHKGLLQRRSFYNMVENSDAKDLESAAMSRQNSSQSQMSSLSLASDGWTKNRVDDKVAMGQPTNFGTVVPGVYRSSYPQEADYPFLQKLGLKTIITLVDKDFPETFQPFMQENGIRHRHIVMEGTKKQTIPIQTMQSILEVVHDKQNHPVLIHCNQGRHRTGCVVALVRKLQQWNVDRILDEYTTYAQPKPRDCDIEYITKFEVAEIEHLGLSPLVESLAIQSKPRHHPLRHLLSAVLLVLAFFSILSMRGTTYSHDRHPILSGL